MDKRLRERIAFEAARLLFQGQESDYVRAKRRAARFLALRFRPNNLPANREIRDQLDRMQQMAKAGRSRYDPRAQQVEALRLMRRLRTFDPILVLRATRTTNAAEPFEIQVTSDDVEAVKGRLIGERMGNTVGPSPSANSSRMLSPTFLYLDGEFPCTVTVSPHSRVPAEGRDRNKRDGLTIDELETRLLMDQPQGDLEAELIGIEPHPDRFEVFRDLLEPLEEIVQSPTIHPEGDALFHSLQVFELAKRERPYDEEFLTAALLHDVGKAVDLKDHLPHTLALLAGLVTRRTLWLIENLPDARRIAGRELSTERRRELEAAEDFHELMLLQELDQAGRVPGARTSSLDDALAFLRSLENDCGWANEPDESNDRR
jgi:predicted HD phosphohydrolase